MIPEGVEYLLLAEPQGREFALLECELDVESAKVWGLNLVADELCDPLDCAKGYAPALALARDARTRPGPASKDEFQHGLTQHLMQYLAAQSTDPYVLAKVRVSQAGYKRVGQYVWIVGYDPNRLNREIAWVSDDYYVYRDSVTDFEVDPLFLEERFAAPKLR